MTKPTVFLWRMLAFLVAVALLALLLAGELIYQLMAIVQKVGGLGEAFRLVGDFAAESWDRMGLRLDAVMARIGAAWEGLKATVFTLLDDTVTGVVRLWRDRRNLPSIFSAAAGSMSLPSR